MDVTRKQREIDVGCNRTKWMKEIEIEIKIKMLKTKFHQESSDRFE